MLDAESREYMGALYAWCIDNGPERPPVNVAAGIMLDRADYRERPFAWWRFPWLLPDYDAPEEVVEDCKAECLEAVAAMFGFAGRGVNALSRDVGGRPSKSTISEWKNHPETLTVKDGGTGNAVYLVSLLYAEANARDGGELADLFAVPGKGTFKERFCGALVRAVTGDDAGSVTHIAEGQGMTDEDRLRRLLVDTLGHLDYRALEALRPIMEDALLLHWSGRGTGLTDEMARLVFEQGASWSEVKEPWQAAANNLSNLMTRHLDWPKVSPFYIPKRTDPESL